MILSDISIQEIFTKALPYLPYRDFVNTLIERGQTTGLDQSIEKIEFTKLNIQRMNRLDKTLNLHLS